MAYEYFLIDKEDSTALVTFNRPKALNAMNIPLLKEFRKLLHELWHDDATKVVIFTGAERSFIAGADIGEMVDMDPVAAQEFADLGHSILGSLEHMAKITIAAVNGFALGGGCEFAMSCDIILASEKAVFAQPEVGLGVTPGFGGTQRLPRIVGLQKAMELIVTGAKIDAAEAHRIGLANQVYPPDELIPEAKKMAAKIGKMGWDSVKMAKKLIRTGLQADLATGCALEKEGFAVLFATEGQKAMMRAFLEKK